MGIMLDQKTLTELRTIAQGLGVADIFSKPLAILKQDIEAKNRELMPQPKIIVPVEYRAIPQGDMIDKDELLGLLKPYTDRGLKVLFTEDTWHYSSGVKSDSGTLRMPYKIALRKAAEVLA